MSLLPLMFSNWWEDLEHPHHIPAQNFAMGVHPDRLPEMPSRSLNRIYSHPLQAFRDIYYPRSQVMSQGERGLSVVKPDKDKFQVSLDVQQFSPDEIKVKVVDNYFVVEGKHDEKRDEHGFVMRQFIRKYLIPEQCDIDKVTSSLSSDGVLTLSAPRKIQPENPERERIVNIEHTGKPALPILPKGSETDKETPEADEKEEKVTAE